MIYRNDIVHSFSKLLLDVLIIAMVKPELFCLFASIDANNFIFCDAHKIVGEWR
jgi:hypothetical protein